MFGCMLRHTVGHSKTDTAVSWWPHGVILCLGADASLPYRLCTRFCHFSVHGWRLVALAGFCSLGLQADSTGLNAVGMIAPGRSAFPAGLESLVLLWQLLLKQGPLIYRLWMGCCGCDVCVPNFMTHVTVWIKTVTAEACSFT